METSRAPIPAPAKDDLATAQRRRLEHFGGEQCVDIHCHCLPCVDDGPGTLPEAMALCRALVEDGVTAAIATPHQLGRYQSKNEADVVRQAVAALNRELMVEGVPLQVLPGADVRLDERISRLLDEGRVLTLADGGVYLLLELPHETFIDPLPLLCQLIGKGMRPIISHPERNRFVIARPQVVEGWLQAGAVLQLTSASFAGDFGNSAQRAAWYWLETGKAALVASDAHGAIGRPPRLTEAIRLISGRLGEEVARRVCGENPRRVLEGREPELPPRRRATGRLS
jgi:protein-tyrosine phosphatase